MIAVKDAKDTANDIKRILLQAKGEFGKSGYLINSGECEDFAVRVIALMGGYTEELTDSSPDFDCGLPGHVWIEYQDSHYDAECLEGVSDWHNLPIFKRHYRTIEA